MSQVNEPLLFSPQLRILRTSNSAVSVAVSGNTTLLESPTAGAQKCSLQFDVTVANLDAFTVQGRVHPDAAYVTFASTAAHYTAPSGRILAASGDLTTVAAGSSGWLDIDITGLEAIKITASASGSAATVSIYAQGDVSGQTNANVTLTASDIEIGAVEIKNGSSDQRATVNANGGVLTALDQTTPGATNGVMPAAGVAAASTAYAASLVVKATGGHLLGFSGYNSGPAQFIQVHNTASLPANGAAPVILLSVGATSNFSWDAGGAAYPFTTGITLANSTTGATLTTGAADCWFNAIKLA